MGTIARKIKQYIDDKGMTVRQFESKAGLSQGFIGKLVTGDRSIGSDKLENILSAFPDIDVELLFNPDVEHIITTSSSSSSVNESPSVYDPIRNEDSFNQIPIFDIEASAGSITVFDDVIKQTPIDHLYIPDAPKCDGAVYVRGDSMYPILKSGDMVCYKMLEDKRSSFIWGEIYLLELHIDGDTMIVTKYVQRGSDDDHILLVSHNKHHQDKEIHLSMVQSFAIVKLWIRKNTI